MSSGTGSTSIVPRPSSGSDGIQRQLFVMTNAQMSRTEVTAAAGLQAAFTAKNDVTQASWLLDAGLTCRLAVALRTDEVSKNISISTEVAFYRAYHLAGSGSGRVPIARPGVSRARRCHLCALPSW